MSAHAGRAHIDFETASPTELAKQKGVGVHRYAEDPETRVWGFMWRIDTTPLEEWRPGYPDPQRLLDHIRGGRIVVAHNAMFERVIWRMMIAKYGLWHWPELQIEQQICTLAKAAAANLPIDLDTLSQTLGQRTQKDVVGKALMLKMAKPRARHANGTFDWWDNPENITRLMQYCGVDVLTECETDELVPDLSPREQKVWELDQRINDRGVYVDINAVVRAVDLVEIAKKRANVRMSEITDGAVQKYSEVTKLLEWVNSQGWSYDQLRKENHEEVLAFAAFTNNEKIRDAIHTRRDAGKSSVAKYQKMMICACSDNRIRGTLQYHGAGPGRWAGRLIQPQNLPRIDTDREGHVPEYVVGLLHSPLPLDDIHDMIEMGCGSVLAPLSKSLRAMIRAEPGNKLYGGDFSNIEGRVNAWLSKEEWKIQAFRDYDSGTGDDLYKLAYARSFGEDVKQVGKGHKRQIGKVQELSMGYQGGVGAFITMGDNYNVKPADVVKPVRAASTPEQWGKTAVRYAKAPDKFGLEEDQWIALKIIVTNWRAAHPNIVRGWWDLGDAALEAVANPGRLVQVYGGRARYVCVDGWLYCQLPSGRVISYARPFIKETTQTLVDENGDEYERTSNVVFYFGKNSTTGKWYNRGLYGGLQCENIVQATARCVMDHAMFRVENAGYPLILTVHDELLAETIKTFGNVKHFEALMATAEPWMDGLPTAVSAWEDERYVK